METIEINIQLDPVRDGTSFVPAKVKRKDKKALVIGTNGQYRIVEEDEAFDILNALSDVSESDYLGKSSYLAVFNGNKLLKLGVGKFLVGSVLVIKGGCQGIEMLNDDEIEEAKNEFITRLVTLCGNNMEFTAYEVG